ncbi:hypothetical protein ABW19_dt0205245 [Dactylella cylindrospora]|nr:hypothetical protein ABW19_dt0205245 [Dactylella cylindrospora]
MKPIASLYLLSLAAFTAAEYEPFDYSNEYDPTGGRGNASITEPVNYPLKFSYWYSGFAPRLTDVSTTVCNLSLHAYQGNSTAREEPGPVKDYCWTHANCILGTIDEKTKASFAGTSILLGLAPTTLSVLGPSVAEMALLSIHRPLITLLLSLGAPAVFPGRFLQWEDPLKANEPAVGAFIVRPFRRPWSGVIMFFQYALAGAAVANVFQAAWGIGIRSIVSWACATSYWPIMWVLSSLVIHLCAILSLRTAIARKQDFGAPRDPDLEATKRFENGVPMNGGGFPGKWVLKSEFTLSSNSEWQVSDLYDVRLGPFPVGLQYTGAFLSVLYLVFGTMLFSSLQFIGVGQAVELIIRLVASATVCRILVQFEVGGMIRVDERRVYKGIVQAPLDSKVE